MAGLLGGFGPEEPADAEVQAASDKVKAQFVKKSGKNPREFKALSYISQVVAGTIYIVKHIQIRYSIDIVFHTVYSLHFPCALPHVHQHIPGSYCLDRYRSILPTQLYYS
ncbi:unnamed protein product [Ranitomeya imitator]|uniref:Cystatin domain-containing protein n=1 Tax=Ranitomeya imitator TaxID=111125 RepID=A0ABN9M5A7_9NEOB|nr:unnamed protein product [Ranitomeya imitator]